MREPAFWWRGAGPQAQLLAPLGFIYGMITARRMAMEGAQAGLPVLCVGNFTLGGAGKTPAVIMLAKMLADGGGRPFCLSRGYGGTEAGPKLVDGRSDSAAQVGDEALLLARAAPTVVARDRVGGAEFARTQGASAVILDDGLQNPSLAKDFTLAVVDARRGIGNARVFPAGPLRAPLDAQLARTDAMLVVGEGNAADGVAARLRARSRPIFQARLVPTKPRSPHSGRKTSWPSRALAIRTSFLRPPVRPESLCQSAALSGPPPVHAARRQRAHPARGAFGTHLAHHGKGPCPHGWRPAPGGARRQRADAAGHDGRSGSR
jgi:tetraacyldisaccharide-1-P 4'-kinase